MAIQAVVLRTSLAARDRIDDSEDVRVPHHLPRYHWRVRIQHPLLSLLLALVASRAVAQPASTPPATTPPIRRWLEFQTFTLSARYRVIESSSDVVTSNHLQYRDLFRARVNIDAKRRFTVNVGAGAGASFISSWDNTGLGTGTRDLHNHYVRHLFAAAAPVGGLEGQFGGLYVLRGEVTETISYDEDGYVTGGRVSVRRPHQLYVDEVSVTRGIVGPFNGPNVNSRWRLLSDPNYTQVLASKRFTQFLAASTDYTRHASADIVHAAVALRFRPSIPLTGLRYEQYTRWNDHAASGFAVTAERQLPRAVRVQGGYATIDQFHHAWNSDRIQRGRRVFALANVPVVGPLSAQAFITRAFRNSYPVALKTRFDAVLTYDVAAALRSTGVF